jgi:beta-galactosidase
MPRFCIDDDFLLDGEPFTILSGAIHYFRVHPGHWQDRIAKARQMGLNTIETYVPWNAHAPEKGQFRLDGGLDLPRFLDCVAAEGMHAIVRPGPYICAEWDNGGLPAWLFRTDGVGIRRSEPAYLTAVEEYLRQLAPILVPRQIDQGGPIILTQIENEYGAYGTDKHYLEALVKINRAIGLTVPFTTVDQPRGDMLDAGSLPGLHKTGSFGSQIATRLDRLRRAQPTGPLMCSEFWDGWFDHWGAHHHTTDVEQSARDLDELLARGASVNIYMFHGGTNFGFTNGANDKGIYQSIVTSYDYDAPLDEAGNPTAKYWAYRDVIAKYAAVPPDRPAPPSDAQSVSVALTRAVSLWHVIDANPADGQLPARDSAEPSTMDAMGQYQGFALYSSDVELPAEAVLDVAEVRDRGQVYLNRRRAGTLSRGDHETSIVLPAAGSCRLEILLEDQGRVDYGPRLGEVKGLLGPVRIGAVQISGWRSSPIDLDDLRVVQGLLDDAPEEPLATLAGPVFARGTFDLSEPGDLFLDTTGLGKGVVWINGFCLGRYWSRGPQQTLYVPGPAIRAGSNELIILELEAARLGRVQFVPNLRLGPDEE